MEYSLVFWSQLLALAMPLALIGFGIMLSQWAGVVYWGIDGALILAAYGFLLMGDTDTGFLTAVGVMWLFGSCFLLLTGVMAINGWLVNLFLWFLGVTLVWLLPTPELRTTADIGFFMQIILPYGILAIIVFGGYGFSRMKWGMVIRGIGDYPEVLGYNYRVKMLQFLINTIGMLAVGIGLGLLMSALNGDNGVLLAVDKNKWALGLLLAGGLGWLMLVLVVVSVWSPYYLILLSLVLVAIYSFFDMRMVVLVLASLLVLMLLFGKKLLLRHAPVAWHRIFLNDE